MFFFLMELDFAGLFLVAGAHDHGLLLVAILVRNLYTGDPCEGVRSFSPTDKKS